MPTGAISETGPSGTAVTQAIANASRQSGVDFGYLLAQAKVESSLNPLAKASTSSAAGLFQFTNQTWLATLSEHGAEHGYGWAASAISRDSKGHFSVSDPAQRQQIMALRYDAQASSTMAAAFAGDNAQMLREQAGIDPEPVDLYLAHFLGGAGAVKFLSAWQSDPDARAAPLFPKAAAANRAIFYGANGQPRTLNDIRERFRAKMGDGSATAPPPMPTRFAQHTAQPTPANERPEPLQMRRFEAMPGKLSLAFAERSYRQLSALGARA
jgi:hypothetical protein